MQGVLDNTCDINMKKRAEQKDNRFLAIIAMNVFAFCSTACSVLFKTIQANGVSVIEFTFFRNAFNLTGAIILCFIFGVGPRKDFPKSCR